MSKWGPWSSVDWVEPIPQARRREAPSVVLKDQDSALFGVAPEYDRLVVAECLYCDAVRRIECIAQHMLDEHPDEIDKKSLEVSPERVHDNHTDEAQQSDSWFVESQQVEHSSGLPAPPGGYIETLVIKKRNPSRRRLRPLSATPEVDVPTTSSGVVPVLASNNLKRSSAKSLLEPALKRKFSLEKDREYDPNEHCGVVSEPHGKPCCYALGACKAHPVRHRRAVPGRRTSYDELVLEHRARAISGVAPPSSDRVSTETSEGSISAGSPAASIGSKGDLRDFEITAAEFDHTSELDADRLPNGVSPNLNTAFTNGVAPGIGTPSENRVSSRLEIPSEIEVPDEIEFLAGTEIVGELPVEAEVSADSMVYAGGFEVAPESKTPSSETEIGRSRFTFEDSSHRIDDVGMMAEDLEITSEEILTTSHMSGVPTTTSTGGTILHITDAALTNDDGPKAGDELTTTIYEVIAINSPDSMGNLTVDNGDVGTDPSSLIDEAFLLSHQASLEATLTMADEAAQRQRKDDEQTHRNESMYLNDSLTSRSAFGKSPSPSRSSEAGSEFLVDPRPDPSPAKFHSTEEDTAHSAESPFLNVESSTLLSPLTSEDLRSPDEDVTSLEIDRGIREDVLENEEEDFRLTDAQQNRSSVFLDDKTAANRFAVIVDPNKDTILSSLLFPNRYTASQNKSELSLRSTTSSTDQLFSEPATHGETTGSGPVSGATVAHDGKLRNLLTRGKPRSRSRLYHRRTERASQDSPGSSGAIAADSQINNPESVEIPSIKKPPPRIHWVMPTQASSHLNRICRLSGENLPEYLRVYLRRPQLADLHREQQGSSMSMSDDLSEVLE